MNNFLKSNVTMLFASALIGCTSTSEPIEPREFQSNYSYAYNLANQTLLTRSDSKLKDFKLEEAEEIKNAPIKHKGGNTSVLFGVTSILTGNLTGAISVAGGTAANLANDPHHAASKSRWLIKLPKSDHKDKQEAIIYAIESIEKSARDYFSQFGTVSTMKGENGYQYSTLEGYNIGLLLNKDMANKAVTEDDEFYYIGYGDKSVQSPFHMIPLAFMYESNELSINDSEMYSKITSTLPENFAIYIPSFGLYYIPSGKYIDYSHRIPAIYQSGVKHEFIKPE